MSRRKSPVRSLAVRMKRVLAAAEAPPFEAFLTDEIAWQWVQRRDAAVQTRSAESPQDVASCPRAGSGGLVVP